MQLVYSTNNDLYKIFQSICLDLEQPSKADETYLLGSGGGVRNDTIHACTQCSLWREKNGSTQLSLENKKNRTAYIYDVTDKMAFFIRPSSLQEWKVYFHILQSLIIKHNYIGSTLYTSYEL